MLSIWWRPKFCRLVKGLRIHKAHFIHQTNYVHLPLDKQQIAQMQKVLPRSADTDFAD